MAGWDSDFNTVDNLLNPNLFARKSFGFQGILKEKEDILKKIVTHIGASCDGYPKYIFTNIDYYNSLTDVNNVLYNVTYIRDCIDANRCLTIEHYKFGPKYSEKKEYREFEPCCANFHSGNEACLLCDPTCKIEQPKLKVTKRRTKNKSIPILEEVTTTKLKKENKVQNSFEANQSVDSDVEHLRKLYWEPWENRMLLDYLICNKLILFAKGPNVYRKMIADGYMKHRSVESMRIHFRTKILRNIETFDLPPAVIKEFRKLKKLQYPGRLALVSTKQNRHVRKIREIKKKIRSSAKES
ncbi:uncharacterized protein LOC131668492 [Phymastichus coffea]|uniref:uncharacterized protein LOC131668492 n=1 Tax=Phymastichus coffea TaxID=108790 RepID=UPI00273BC5C3|nr:uncharacterized protein LOC131668492 [Phymastichus coffea]XP_058798693.1 uncharacterized protein LOC131668492 [Phymastichus coffea]